jgi:hypothetical protein
MRPTKQQGIGAAIIAALAALVVGYWQFIYKSSASDTNAIVQYSGRVVDSGTRRVIPGAKVSVDSKGVPQVYYSDSDGVFYLKLPASDSVRIRVEANGYETFERNVSLSRTGIEDVRLQRLKVDISPGNQNLSSTKNNRRSSNRNQQNQIDKMLRSEPSNRPN